MSIHLVLYSNNEPFNTTKRLTIESIYRYTNKNVIIHDYNLEKIQLIEGYQFIKNFPYIIKNGRRDGYYNSWKPLIIKDVYDKIIDGDILYYVDSSQYYKTGFTENIDKLCNIVNEKLCIAGSVGNDFKNTSFDCCNNLIVWNKIIKDTDNNQYLSKLHVLNSWFLFKKCKSNDAFINEWVYFSYYVDKDIIYPLITYHHTVDQSIFNILAIKHNCFVFYHKQIKHEQNKNKNLVLNIINNAINPIDFIKVLLDC